MSNSMANTKKGIMNSSRVTNKANNMNNIIIIDLLIII